MQISNNDSQSIFACYDLPEQLTSAAFLPLVNKDVYVSIAKEKSKLLSKEAICRLLEIVTFLKTL